ncbi:golgin subfamily A member 6-like protein 6 [Polyergus mexicanus]|uniref:golgin subfamily A member 6-like protein 6 n=1 Tax=Polyergus mexicanus TaxID=615972 RepID=UPI0038B590E2
MEGSQEPIIDPSVMVEAVMGGTRPDGISAPQGETSGLETPTFDLMDTTPPPDDLHNGETKPQRKRMAEDGSPKSEEEEDFNISYRLRKRRNRPKIVSTEEEDTVIEGSEMDERRSDTEIMREENEDESSRTEEKDKEKDRKVGRPKKRVRRVVSTPEMELGSNFEQFAKAEFREVGAVSLSALGTEWLEDLDLIRAKCGRLNEKLNGQMKDRVGKLKDVIKAFVEKAESVDDPLTLRMRINKLKHQLEIKDELDKKRSEELMELKKINADLRKELSELHEKVDILMSKKQIEEQERESRKASIEVGKQGKKEKRKKQEMSFLEERLELIRKDDPSVGFITAPKAVIDGKLVLALKPETEVEKINKKIRNKEKEIAELLKNRIEAKKIGRITEMKYTEQEQNKQDRKEGRNREDSMQMEVEEFEGVEVRVGEIEEPPIPLPQRPPRPVLRIKENIQLRPPFEQKEGISFKCREEEGGKERNKDVKKEEISWTKVVKKGKKGRKNRMQKQDINNNMEDKPEKERNTTVTTQKPKEKTSIGEIKIKTPKTSAVTITG